MFKNKVLSGWHLMLTITFLFAVNGGYSQITSGNIDPEKEKEKTKEKKN